MSKRVNSGMSVFNLHMALMLAYGFVKGSVGLSEKFVVGLKGGVF
jgi:hypothetical protein